MTRCRPEQSDTKEHGNMLNRESSSQKKDRCRTENATGWKVDGDKTRVTREECKRLREEFEVGGFTAQKRVVEYQQKEKVGRQRFTA